MAADGSVVIQIAGDDKEFRASLGTLGGVATSALKGVATAVTVAGTAIAGLATAAAKVGAEFETALAGTSTMFGDVEVDTKGLTDQILALSNSSGIAAADITGSLYNALSAGIPVTEDMTGAMEYMESSTMLAAAGFTDVDTAVTATAKVMNAYGMSLDDVDSIHKVMLQTQNKGITTVNELGATLAQVTPTAAAMGVSFENVGAALATMTAQGTPTAQATTQLNSLLAELGKSGTVAAGNLEKAAAGTQYAGKSFSQLMDEGVPLNEVLDLMGSYADENGLSMIDMFSSIEAGKAALAMAGENSATYAENLAAMSTEADVVGDAYATVTDTLEHKLSVLKESVSNLGIAVYDGMAGPLKETAALATGWIGEITAAFTSGGLEGAVGALGSVFAQAITYLAGLAPQMLQAGVGLLQSLLTGIQSNLPALAQGAVGIVTSLVSGIITLLPQLAITAVQLLTELARGIAEALPTLIPAAYQAVITLVQGLVANIPALIEAALQLIRGLADGLLAAVPLVYEAIPAILINLVTALLESIPLIIQTGIDLLTALVTALPEIIAAIVAVLPQIIDGVITALLENLPLIIQAGIDLLVALIQALPEIITTIVAALPQIITSIVDALVGNIDKIILAGVQLFVALVQNLPTIIVEIVKAVPQIVMAIVQGFAGLASSIADIGANMVKGIWDGIVGMTSWIGDKVTGFFSGIVEGVKDFLGIHSPSKAFAELGGFTMEGFAIGMKSESGKVIKTAGELSESILKAASGWVSDRKFYQELSAKDEADFWKELIQIGGLGAKELAEVDKRLYSARAAASKESYEHSKNWIEQEKFYQRLSAEEEIAAWQRVVDRKNLSAQEQMQAERSLFSAEQALLKEQQTAREELLNKQEQAQKKVLKEQEKALEEYQRAVESRTQSLEGFVGLFDAIEKKSDTSGQALLKNLRDQVSAFQSWQADLQAIEERGVTGGLLEELREMGPKAAEQLHALTKLSDKELEEYAALFAEKGRLASEQAQKDIPPVRIPLVMGELGVLELATKDSLSGAAEGGTALVEGMAGAAVDALPQVKGVAGQAVSTFSSAVLGCLSEVSKAGAELMGTLCDLVAAKQPDVARVASSTVATLCNTIRSRYSEFYGVGVDAMSGFHEGLEIQGQKAIATARRIADQIITTMQMALDIHSPSRKMRDLVGIPTAQGFFVGFEDEMDGLSRRMQSAVDAETSKVGLHAAAQAEGRTGGQEITREYRSSERVVEKIARVEGDGLTDEVVRLLNLKLRAENARIGSSLLAGG